MEKAGVQNIPAFRLSLSAILTLYGKRGQLFF
jgi:hypothetical protein